MRNTYIPLKLLHESLFTFCLEQHFWFHYGYFQIASQVLNLYVMDLFKEE